VYDPRMRTLLGVYFWQVNPLLLVARLSMAVSSDCAKSKKQSVGAASAGRKSLALANSRTSEARRRGEGRMCKRIFRKSLRFARYQIRRGTASLRSLIRRKAPSGSER
jgi:hypothetical protein